MAEFGAKLLKNAHILATVSFFLYPLERITTPNFTHEMDLPALPRGTSGRGRRPDADLPAPVMRQRSPFHLQHCCHSFRKALGIPPGARPSVISHVKAMRRPPAPARLEVVRRC